MLALALLLAAQAEWDARTLFEKSAIEGLRLSADGSAIELDRGVLVEDDGPAAGKSYKPQDEEISGARRIRKEFLLPDPRAGKATLLVAPGGDLGAIVNGKEVPLRKEGSEGTYWQAYAFDPAALVAGRNEIVLHGTGKVWIARDDEYAAGSLTRTGHPNRSARSDDGGRTWRDAGLGRTNDVDGEYLVRLHLDRHRSEGWLTLPVIDAGNLEGRAVAPPVSSVEAVRVLSLGTHEAPRVLYAIRGRSGPTPVAGSAGWSDWENARPQELPKPAGRYVQLQVRFETSDPRATPRLRRLLIQADVTRPADWTGALKVLEARNPEIVRSSIPFRYEPFDRPELKTLRETRRLDEVVRGAKGEFELVTRLAAWSSGLWSKGHLNDAYPPWNALEILKPHADGTPVGGFCQQKNLVFLQACESFGLAGRAVSISQGGLGDRIRGSGHEVVEIWSNEHAKWIYVDGDAAWYGADEERGTPLSLLELRERQLAALAGRPHRSVRIVRLAGTKYAWEGLTAWPPFGELRLIPRSNFLEERAPLPLNQGLRGWFWTGHAVWTDDELPASRIYPHRVRRRGDFEWTLNRIHVTLEAGAARGELRVHLDTETPGFETFLVRIDGGDWTPARTGFAWSLRPGRNLLEVRSRNRAGREGITSSTLIESP
jgi:hypothetical protein